MYYYIIIAAIVALDQIVKYAVRTGMDLGTSIPIIEGIFHLTYIQNTGAAFSMLEGQRLLLLVLPCVLVLIICIYIGMVHKREKPLMMVALSMIAAGGLGNLIDRALFSSVVDFLDFRIWPIFNVADISVCVGSGLLIIFVFFSENKKRKGENGEG